MIDRDEQLAGWLDGTLPPEQATEFESAMAQDASLARKAEAWRGNDALLRSAFNGPIEQGVDARLLARMGLAEPAPQLSAANDNPPLRRWALPLGSAIAAGLALALVLSGNPLSTGSGQGPGAQFAEAMDRLPSRGELAMADGSKVSPVLSFAAADGRYCREFAVTGGANPGGGIACKGVTGWTVEARTNEATRLADDGRIVAAGATDAGDLEAAFERLGASDPISAKAEQDLIAKSWASGQ